jgi:hypothetical protein
MTGYEKNKEEEFLTATAPRTEGSTNLQFAAKEGKNRGKMLFILSLFRLMRLRGEIS